MIYIKKNNFRTKLYITVLIVILSAFYATEYRAEREISLKYVSYDDNNDANVNTEGINLSYEINSKTSFTFGHTIDGITAASRKIPIITGPIIIVDGVTAATKKTTDSEKPEYRKDYSIGLSRKIKENTLSVMLDSSREDDYSSFSYFLSWTSEFDDRNKAISFSYSNYNDELSPFGVTWKDKRTSNIFDLSFTNVLTPRSQMRAAVSYSYDDGFLSNPYHRIRIDDYYFTERHPVVRDKIALGLFYNLGFEGNHVSSLQFDYRYYYDNWEIQSNTFGAKFNHYLFDWLMISLRERLYLQTEAFFFKNKYLQEERFMTADPKYAAFTSLLAGFGFTINITREIAIELSFEHYNYFSDVDYNQINQSVSKKDLISNIFFISTHIKL